MTILLVDDDPTMRLAASYALSAAGHRVIEAENGVDALSLAAAEPPDLLLLDVMLGDEDGTQLAARLRTLPQLAKTPLVFLTGRADAERARLLAFGAVAVLAKPFDVTTLAATIEQAVSA